MTPSNNSDSESTIEAGPPGDELPTESIYRTAELENPIENIQGKPPMAVDDAGVRYVSTRSVAQFLRIAAGIFGVKLLENGSSSPEEADQFWYGVAIIAGLIFNVVASNWSFVKQLRIAIALPQDATLKDWKDSVNFRKSYQGIARWFGTKRLSIILIPLLAIWTCAAACNRETLIQQNGRAISAFDGAISVADSANRNKLLDNEKMKLILDAGDAGVAALREVNGFAADFPSKDDPVPESKKKLILEKLNDAAARFQTLVNNGKFIKDPANQAKFNNIISPGRAALTSIINAINGWPTKPDPSPTPSPSPSPTDNKTTLNRFRPVLNAPLRV